MEDKAEDMCKAEEAKDAEESEASEDVKESNFHWGFYTLVWGGGATLD